MNARRLVGCAAVLALALGSGGRLRALTLEPASIAEITTGAGHQVYGWSGEFAVSGNLAAWIDGRDPNANRVYGVRLDEPNYREFLIDMEASAAAQLAFSERLLAYKGPMPEAEQPEILRLANLANLAEISRTDFVSRCLYIYDLDLSGTRLAYAGQEPNSYQMAIYLADVSNPNQVEQYRIDLLGGNDGFYDLAIDGKLLSWSLEYYYEPNEVYRRALRVADVSDPHHPDIVTYDLPQEVSLYSLDASGAWLAAQGQEDYRNGIYGVFDYRDREPQHWRLATIWTEKEQEYYRSGPRVDGPYTVWVAGTRAPSAAGRDGPADNQDEGLLKGAYLMPDAGFATSTLHRSTSEMGAADVSGQRVVWSEYLADATELYQGTISLECGDWGYFRGDLDRNCQVNLMDLAIFAADWLRCSVPFGGGCEYAP